MGYKFKEIEDAKREVDSMKSSLPFFRNEERKRKEINRINTFIRLINASERLVSGSCDRDIVDSVLLHLFKMEYEKAQYDGVEGFVDYGIVEFIKSSMAMSISKGRESMKNSIAFQIAADMVSNSAVLTEEEKEQSVENSSKVKLVMKDAVQFWKGNIDRVIAACHAKRNGVWKS